MTDEQISAALVATERFGHPNRWKWRLWLIGAATKLGLAFLVENFSSFAINLLYDRYVPVLQRHFPWHSTEDWIKRTLPPDIIEMACGESRRPVPAQVIEAIQVNIGRGEALLTHYRAKLFRCVAPLFVASTIVVLGIDTLYLLNIKAAFDGGSVLGVALNVLAYLSVMASTAIGLGSGAQGKARSL